MSKNNPFSKSSSDRYSRWVSEELLDFINKRLLSLLSQSQQEDSEVDFNFEEDLDFENYYFDSTCLEVKMHYPVDWVLFRDITRTLMKALVLLRKHGIKNRMAKDPLDFLSEMNSICMKMTSCYGKKDAVKKRKKILREMKALLKKVVRHAQRHLELLVEQGDKSGLSEGRRAVIQARLEDVLAKIPKAEHQAHERIIGERQVKSQEKMLSLYEEEVEVCTRGKSGARVEFGNQLFIAETSDGLIADYQLLENQESDSKLVGPAIDRLQEIEGVKVESVYGDRGFESEKAKKALEEKGVYNGLCPNNVQELKERLSEEDQLKQGLKRRAGVEARISILSNRFLKDKPEVKGLENRKRIVGWAVLVHNLWVLARRPQKKKERKQSLVA